ncbi:expressed unknown protein [Seminavis robusta]|uniref:Uncharacterized protein n=1 Tax=Seminavis robusta TaxID=568900 RepID=A0A9N8HDR1_9STRA|nr:expressed unknown protein [Seminavis robusta]|eukprot:Sro373_g128970.1 n/a (470) ;mRNA; f:16086-17495
MMHTSMPELHSWNPDDRWYLEDEDHLDASDHHSEVVTNGPRQRFGELTDRPRFFLGGSDPIRPTGPRRKLRASWLENTPPALTPIPKPTRIWKPPSRKTNDGSFQQHQHVLSKKAEPKEADGKKKAARKVKEETHQEHRDQPEETTSELKETECPERSVVNDHGNGVTRTDTSSKENAAPPPRLANTKTPQSDNKETSVSSKSKTNKRRKSKQGDNKANPGPTAKPMAKPRFGTNTRRTSAAKKPVPKDVTQSDPKIACSSKELPLDDESLRLSDISSDCENESEPKKTFRSSLLHHTTRNSASCPEIKTVRWATNLETRMPQSPLKTDRVTNQEPASNESHSAKYEAIIQQQTKTPESPLKKTSVRDTATLEPTSNGSRCAKPETKIQHQTKTPPSTPLKTDRVSNHEPTSNDSHCVKHEGIIQQQAKEIERIRKENELLRNQLAESHNKAAKLEQKLNAIKSMCLED